MRCPQCGKILHPVNHGDLVCDGQIWCDGCRRYDDRLLQNRTFAELETWSRQLCRAFAQAPVELCRDPDYLPDPQKYYNGATFLLAEADHYHRTIMLHPPGHRLTTLCHELAHLFTGQDHTAEWARTCAALIAWVKTRL